MQEPRRLRVVFVHPDLGIGGAERLVVDAAMGLQSLGHEVVIYTSHHDRNHCFKETRESLDVRVRGDWLPRHIFGRFHILCAILRSLWLAHVLLLFEWGVRGYDVVFSDQLSASIPLFRLLTSAKVLFYCHFPDQLLTQKRSPLRRLYRLPFDLFEEWTTGLAHRILVNSDFTRQTFQRTFPRLVARKGLPAILYPAVNLRQLEQQLLQMEAQPAPDTRELMRLREAGSTILVSINRFERKKNIRVAIAAFALLCDKHVPGSTGGGQQQQEEEEAKQGAAVAAAEEKRPAFRPLPADTVRSLKLIVAGGYDPRVAENVEHHRELQEEARRFGLSTSDFPDTSGQVIFLRSFSESQRAALLHLCRCVVYTPENEHFGIVPVEAMFSRRPVVAPNSGGPRESIVPEPAMQEGSTLPATPASPIGRRQTGYLCRTSRPHDFADAIAKAIALPDAEWKAMGAAARERVQAHFSLDSFSKQLEQHCLQMTQQPTRRGRLRSLLHRISGIAIFIIVLAYCIPRVQPGLDAGL